MTPRLRPLLLTLLALAACGAGPEQKPDYDVRGAAVYVNSDALFTQGADFRDRLESTLDAALAYWGGSWSDLAGRSISLEGSTFVACHGVASATGCFDGNIRISTSDLGRTFSCVEETELVHEVGHAVLGDAAHQDPRWMDFVSVAQALSGRAGYSGAGETGCPIIENVWQHPPDL
jgi:predicted small lipoprotein YifL